MADRAPTGKEKKKLEKKKSLGRLREMFRIGTRRNEKAPAGSPESSPDWVDDEARARETQAAGKNRRDEVKSTRPSTSSAPNLHTQRSFPNLAGKHNVEARTPGTTGFNVLRKQSEPNLRAASRRSPEDLPPLPPLPPLFQPPISPGHQRSQAATNIPKIPSTSNLRQVNSGGSTRRIMVERLPPAPSGQGPPGWI